MLRILDLIVGESAAVLLLGAPTRFFALFNEKVKDVDETAQRCSSESWLRGTREGHCQAGAARPDLAAWGGRGKVWAPLTTFKAADLALGYPADPKINMRASDSAVSKR